MIKITARPTRDEEAIWDSSVGIFEEERCWSLLYARIKAREQNRKLSKWTFKDKNYPKGTVMKIYYFHDLYSKKRN
jgi:hypothetical protein